MASSPTKRSPAKASARTTKRRSINRSRMERNSPSSPRAVTGSSATSKASVMAGCAVSTPFSEINPARAPVPKQSSRGLAGSGHCSIRLLAGQMSADLIDEFRHAQGLLRADRRWGRAEYALVEGSDQLRQPRIRRLSLPGAECKIGPGGAEASQSVRKRPSNLRYPRGSCRREHAVTVKQVQVGSGFRPADRQLIADGAGAQADENGNPRVSQI